MYEISVMVGLAVGGLVIFLLAVALARRTRARALARADARAGRRADGPEAGEAAGSASDPMARRLELRLDEIETRLEAGLEAQAGSGGEERLRAMAESLVGLIRDKNATLETALAGLDQLRARLRALEQMGDLAEARGLFERLEARIDDLRATQASQGAAFEERVAGLAVRAEAEAAPGAALAEQFSRLYARKDEGIAAMLARIAPFEARLAEIETARAAEGPAREAMVRLETRLEALRGAQETSQIELAALKTEIRTELGAGPVAAIAERLGGLHAQKEALVETLLARIAALEEAQITRDPKAALDRFAERLEAAQAARLEAERSLRDRVAALETPGESPFAEISAQLTRLYGQKDAAVETVLARLAPLEARLAEVEAGLASQDPRAALDRFAERLEAAQTRLLALEAPERSPFAEISEQLTRLYAQKDTDTEAVQARLAPLETRLRDLEADIAARDPRAVLDAFAARLDAAQAVRAAAETSLRDRIAALESPGENPFAEISEQLTRLYGQKDATVETVFARLAPLEERLGRLEEEGVARDPRAALDRFAERLEAAQAARIEVEGALRERLGALENPGENPFAEISAQLTRLYAQKDATVETVFARLAPLETRLEEMATGLAPRVAALEAIEDPRATLAELGARIEALRAEGGAAETRIEALRETLGEAVAERPFAEIAAQLTRLYAQKDAHVAAVAERLAPLEIRLAELEARPAETGREEEEARAEAQAIATQMIAARAAAEQTELFANRLALLEASLPRISAAQTRLNQVLERQAAALAESVSAPLAELRAPAGSGPTPSDFTDDPDLAALQELPRVVSLHLK